jgi:hypothetical protein
LDNTNSELSGVTATTVEQVAQGVYCTKVFVPVDSDSCGMFRDVWSNIVINGVARPDVELRFAVLDDEDYFQIGTSREAEPPKRYGFNVRGIKRDEHIKRGDVRKIIVEARKEFKAKEQEAVDCMEYRLFIKEGGSEITIIDWKDVNKSDCENYFLLDTCWMIPQTYYLDVKITSNQEVRHYQDLIKFKITPQNELCEER